MSDGFDKSCTWSESFGVVEWACTVGETSDASGCVFFGRLAGVGVW